MECYNKDTYIFHSRKGAWKYRLYHGGDIASAQCGTVSRNVSPDTMQFLSAEGHHGILSSLSYI